MFTEPPTAALAPSARSWLAAIKAYTRHVISKMSRMIDPGLIRDLPDCDSAYFKVLLFPWTSSGAR